MKNGSILLISNHPDVSRQIGDKIKLLREGDAVNCVSFLESISVLNSYIPSLIILYWTKEDSINIVREIRTIKALDKVPIVFVMDKLIEEILFNAFDYGIDEFFYLNDPDSVILMRIFLAMQKSVLYKKIDTAEEIMQETGIIDAKTGLYSSEYSSRVLKYLVNKSIEDNLEDTVFMFIKAIPVDKKFLNISRVATFIKSVPRSGDIVAFAENAAGFYMILYGAGRIGAKSVLQRLKKVLEGACEVYVNSCEITTDYEDLKKILTEGMNEQILVKNDFNFYYNADIKEFLDAEAEKDTTKNLSDSKNLYREFEKIILPVFYHFQEVYSNSISNARISYDVTEEQSYFIINSEDVISKIIITFPMYSKVIIDIMHKVEADIPSTQRKTYDFKDFNEQVLSEILKEAINEFIKKSGQIGMTNIDKDNE